MATRLLDYIRGVTPSTGTSLGPAASMTLSDASSEEEALSLDDLAAALQSASAASDVLKEETEVLVVECRSLDGSTKLIELPIGATAFDLRRALDFQLDDQQDVQPALYCDGIILEDDAFIVGGGQIVHVVRPSRVTSLVAEEMVEHVCHSSKPSPTCQEQAATRPLVALRAMATLVSLGLLLWLLFVMHPLPTATPVHADQSVIGPNSSSVPWKPGSHLAPPQKDDCHEGPAPYSLAPASRAAPGLEDATSSDTQSSQRSLVESRATRPLLAVSTFVFANMVASLPTPNKGLNLLDGMDGKSSADGKSAAADEDTHAVASHLSMWKRPFAFGRQLGQRATNFLLNALQLALLRLWRQFRRSIGKSTQEE